jgi:hypothetical protein
MTSFDLAGEVEFDDSARQEEAPSSPHRRLLA